MHTSISHLYLIHYVTMQKISILPNHSDNISLYAYVKQVEDFRVTSYHIKFLSCCELLNMIKKKLDQYFKNTPKVQELPQSTKFAPSPTRQGPVGTLGTPRARD